MEFWGVEVKSGEPLKCEPGFDKYLHLSHASLGESKKEKTSEPIRLYVKVGDQKLVLGTLSSETCAQISFYLVFEKDFELSHSWKNGSVHFCGYKAIIQEESDAFTESDSEDEDIPIKAKENGKPEAKEQPKPTMDKANAAKPESSAAKKVKLIEPKKDDEDDEEDEDEQEEDESEEDESDDEDILGVGDQSDDEDESSEEEDEATPKKAEPSKKRPAEPSASKTPVPDKKAKLVTPAGQKMGGKKGGHTATPYPSKPAAKTPANSDKSKPQTPKSGGQFSCKPCNKSFNSDGALQSHNKAKHSAGK